MVFTSLIRINRRIKLKLLYRIQKIINDIEAKCEFKVPDANETLNFMVKAWNNIIVENFQYYWNITQIIENKAFLLMNEITHV